MHKTMMHLCIKLYTDWTPLVLGTYWTSLILFVLLFVWEEAETLHSAYLRKLHRTGPGRRHLFWRSL